MALVALSTMIELSLCAPTNVEARTMLIMDAIRSVMLSDFPSFHPLRFVPHEAGGAVGKSLHLIVSNDISRAPAPMGRKGRLKRLEAFADCVEGAILCPSPLLFCLGFLGFHLDLPISSMATSLLP
ncbi:hypothetical protein ELI02_32730 [Rhizobium leguminosarum]|uniref:Uncharacterized protein n=1 Tax=Rhizobium leguminosarum TaxID=384 RepID=A0A444HWT0_RHILE|nr:hypothetical protein EHH54_32675 [Rhizobium leguminosarum]TAW02585.1 hypothetical protein ELI25_36815 [Rhizobium ruizarguesonis]TAU83843.1 hypothetical protein ELI40_11455 [Rhizobium leguminosarum]TAU89018.1 hypothetical protein ELI41_10855 [Rhizobium leguminosarum]TAV40984.1 hypothetical protein ELI31_33700 [Rhizobium leguminosarum]